MDQPLQPASSRIPANAERVLVLQGGGALGSYQAGAFHALCHHGFDPDWVAGISIGAVNAAIIAGNEGGARVERLKEFWEMVSAPVPWRPPPGDGQGRSLFNATSAALIATFGVPGFFAPRVPPAPLWPPGHPEALSYYDTAPLKKTLERLVDFDRINDVKTRLSVGAVGVTSGNFRYFDNVEFKKLGKKIGPEHIMASGALPPGFPSIVIDGEHYWDGGIASNTPLDFVLDSEVDRDLLIFQIDLFSAKGPLPASLLDAAEREKDIRYSSRTRLNTDKNKQLHNTRVALRELLGRLPDDLRRDPSVELLCKAAKENTVTVVHLIYRSKNYESSAKDYDFSHAAMVEHWEAGVRDVHLSMRHKDWLERPQSGETMVTYDLTGDVPAAAVPNRSE
jgi:NTE family protein